MTDEWIANTSVQRMVTTKVWPVAMVNIGYLMAAILFLRKIAQSSVNLEG